MESGLYFGYEAEITMKFPVTFGFESVEPVHYFFEVLAFFVGVRLYYYLKKRTVDPISNLNRLWILVGAMIGALLGSRILAALETPSQLYEMTWLTFYQNKTVAGGFFGGLFGVELIKKIIGEKSSSGDLYVIPIVVAVFIGRIGCFFAGISEPTHGIETTFFMGMDLGDGLKRHPTALYEMLFMLFLLFLFWKIKKVDLLNGDRFKLFMVLYFLYRFGIEFLKPFEPLFSGLSSIHWSALFIFVYYVPFLIRIAKKFKT